MVGRGWEEHEEVQGDVNAKEQAESSGGVRVPPKCSTAIALWFEVGCSESLVRSHRNVAFDQTLGAVSTGVL